MTTKLDLFNKTQARQKIPDIRAGDIVRVYQKIPISKKQNSATNEKESKRGQKIQFFEGLVIARKHGQGPNATITVRKIASGVGVEKIFPLSSPTITKIEIIKRSKVRRAKLYYIRERKGKKAKIKTKKLLGVEWSPIAPKEIVEDKEKLKGEEIEKEEKSADQLKPEKGEEKEEDKKEKKEELK